MSFTRSLSDTEFSALKKGRKQGFDAAWELYSNVIYSFAMHLTKDAMLAEDVMQNVFETLLTKASTIKEKQAMGGWLKTATQNACWQAFRKKKELPCEQQETLEHLTELMDEYAREGILWKKLEALPFLQRTVVYMRVVAENNHTEIASTLDINEAHSRQLYKRAMTKLKVWTSGEKR